MYATCQVKPRILLLWISHSSRTMPIQMTSLGLPSLRVPTLLRPSSMKPILLYILKAGILSSNTVNDIRLRPSSWKPYVINQCISSVPKPRPRNPVFSAIPIAASRSGPGLKLRLTCPMNSSHSLSSTTRNKTEPLAIDSIVLCKNCSVRVGERSSMKDKRWTTGSLQRFKNAPSSVEAYGRKMVRTVSHREYGKVGAFMPLVVLLELLLGGPRALGVHVCSLPKRPRPFISGGRSGVQREITSRNAVAIKIAGNLDPRMARVPMDMSCCG